MNKAYVNQTGGLRLDTDILEFGLEAPKIIQCLGYLAHDLAIIQGCSESNNIVSDGFLFINGEILPFKQSQKNANNTVVIVEEKIKRVFKTGQNKDVLFDRYVEFGISTISFQWSNFYRVKSLKQLETEMATKASADALNSLITRVDKLEVFARPFAQGGSMLFWNKPADQIPVGWREVEDWRGRMPVGWNPDDIDFSTVSTNGGVKNPNISIPSTGWTAGSPLLNQKPSGQLVVTNGQTELGEALESISVTAPKLIETYNLNPYRIVIFIEPIPTV